MTIKLRSYQHEAVAAVRADLDAGVMRPAVVLPTGGGKTIVFADLIAKEFGRGKALIIAHRDELITQARDKYLSVNPGASVGVVKAERNETDHPVIVSSVQTLAREGRRSQLTGVGLVVVDEAHHAVAQTYRDVLTHYGVPAVGFTATLARGDGKALGDVWEKISYQMPLLRMIRMGYLADVKGVEIRVPDLDLKGLGKSAGDYREGELGERLQASIAPQTVAQAYRQHGVRPDGGVRPGILFAPTVATAQLFADALCAEGFRCEAVWGAMPLEDRRRVLREFDEGKIDILSNCMVLTEGFDSPRAEVAVIARPTQSSPLYCLDEQTEILTDQGWRGVDDDLSGARPAAYDLDDGAVRWSDLLGRVERPLGPDESMFALSSPTADVRVSDRHRMVWRGRNGTWKVSTARDLSERRSTYLVPIAGEQKAPGVPLTDDELRFVGWFMTDGSLNRVTNQIVIYQAEHQPWNADIRAMLDGCGFKYTVGRSDQETEFNRTSTTFRYMISKGVPRGTDKHLRGWGTLEPYLSKNIAPALEDMTREQTAVLLEAMHLGDGAKQIGQTWTRRSYHISTGNKIMADRLQSLAVRRGFKCNLAVHTYNTSPLYVLHVKDTTEKWVGGSGANDRESFQSVPSEPGERVWCVETDAGTIITRRNGKVMIMGNCQMVGRVLRLYPGKEYALVLDVVGAAGKHELCTLATLAGERIKDVKESKSLLQALDETGTDQCGTCGIPREDCALVTRTAEYGCCDECTHEPEAEGGGYVGDVVSQTVDLFAGSRQQWLQTFDGHWFIPAGERIITLVPARGGVAFDVVWFAVKTKGGGYVARDVMDLGMAMAHGEGEITWDEEMMAAKDRAWRKRRRTEKQLGYARMLGIKVDQLPENMRAGQLGDLISIALASKRVDKLIKAKRS